MKILQYIFPLAVILSACSNANTQSQEAPLNGEHFFDVHGFTNEEYSDNPDIGFMAKDYLFNYINKGKISKEPKDKYSLSFFTEDRFGDSIVLKDLNLAEFIPSLSLSLKQDPYLEKIGVINQEWNRNQVSFSSQYFESSNPNITRVDIARNCLNSYLWEIILYTDEQDNELPLSHGWFNFPKELYQLLFSEKNGQPFEKYSAFLENWVDPENRYVDNSLLRDVIDTLAINFENKSASMYPLQGARKKKYKEIIYPPHFKTMKDLQTDSTLFATFTPPGIYAKSDPRRTELGRLKNLMSINVYRTLTPLEHDSTYEIEMLFVDSNNRNTKFYLGGIDLATMPVLTPDEANKGWKNSMGFSNHTFYETYEQHIQWNASTNPYYAFLTDGNNNWLDSHAIGIDGPVLFWDKDVPGHLHLWLLSFERHAFVGHYVMNFQKKVQI